MKLIVIGFGQCGNRIADEFARLNRRARQNLGIEIVTGAFAVNTDSADLSGLSHIRPDYQHRILIGGATTGGHGVGKINELSARLARDDADKVVDAIRSAPRFYETDAFLLIGSSGGGTGSGCLPVITEHLKERYLNKPVYNMVVLPFRHEETTEERSAYNSATCLRSVSGVADAVFLIDNQRFIKKDLSLRNNMATINASIVEPFYNLLCAGEEKRRSRVGTKTMDAGDIIQTLVGWTVLGHGSSPLPRFGWSIGQSRDFRSKSTETHKGIQAIDEAISELSLNCNPALAGKALYLVSAPHRFLNMSMAKDLGEYMRSMAPEAIIRSGDYPRPQQSIHVTTILSELSEIEKVKEYYRHAIRFTHDMQRKLEEINNKRKEIEELERQLPSLLHHNDGS